MPTLNCNYMYLERDGIDLTAYFTSDISLEEFEYRHSRPMGFSPDEAEQSNSVGYEIKLRLVIDEERLSEYKKYLRKNSVSNTVFDDNTQRIEGLFEILWLENQSTSFQNFWVLEVAMRSVFHS